MQQHFTKSVWLTTLLVTGIFALAFSAYAQMGSGMTGGSNGMHGACAPQMATLQHDMASQMMAMSGAMSKGGMSPALQQQMSQRMQTMANMMGDMSGMMGKGMMNGDGQKRMQQMRMQMDTLMHGAQQPVK